MRKARRDPNLFFIVFCKLNTYPFSKCKFVWGDPISIPSATKDDEIEKYKLYLEEKINYCTNTAQSNLDV